VGILGGTLRIRYGFRWAAVVLAVLLGSLSLTQLGHVGSAQAATFTPEVWNGSTWTPTPETTLPGVSLVSASLACASTQLCFVAGHRSVDGGSTPEPVIAQWNGKKWHVDAVATVAGGGILTGVGCLSTTFCFAIGAERSEPSRPLLEHWDGTSWTVEKALKDPPDSEGSTQFEDFYSMSCSTADVCVALGSLSDGAQTLAEVWNGLNWTATDIDGEFFSVVCDTDSCTAAGDESDGEMGSPELNLWTDTGLSIPQPMAPDPSVSEILLAGACASDDSCVVVGEGNGEFAESWDGNSWTYIPSPAGAIYGYEDMACASATQCLYGTDDEWTGTEWTTALGQSGGAYIDCLQADDWCMTY
jgi:hypothetical protein